MRTVEFLKLALPVLLMSLPAHASSSVSLYSRIGEPADQDLRDVEATGILTLGGPVGGDPAAEFPIYKLPCGEVLALHLSGDPAPVPKAKLPPGMRATIVVRLGPLFTKLKELRLYQNVVEACAEAGDQATPPPAPKKTPPRSRKNPRPAPSATPTPAVGGAVNPLM